MSGSQVAELVGSRLGERYRLEAVLGHGGMSVVYRAVDEALGREVAVKVFAASTADAAELRRQESEVRMLAGLSHPGLVTLFDAGADTSERGSIAYIVMELVSGDTLQGRMLAGPMAPPEVAAIGADLADALHYIHRRGVVHRDIKPANVLLSSNSAEDTTAATKLADFGIARIIDGTHLTATGSIIGTVSYLSPEQAMGSTVDASADIYALGLVLLECLTGAKVFPGSAAESASARVLRDPDVPGDVPEPLRQLLRAMTSRVPTERPSARDAADALRAMQTNRAGTDTPTEALAAGRAPSAGDYTDTEAMTTIGGLAAVDESTRALDATGLSEVRATRPLPAAAVTNRLPAAGDASPAVARAASPPPALPLEATPTEAVPVLGVSSAAPNAVPRRVLRADERSRKRRPWAAIVAAILLVLASIIGWGVIQGMNTGSDGGTVEYPSVPGELGTSLEELQRSVEEPE